MEFSIERPALEKALKIIKNSKSIGRSGEEDSCNLLIRVKKDPNEIEFLTNNMVNWSCSVINNDVLSKDYNIENMESIFSVEEEGSSFVDVHEFIDIISTYPSNLKINFKTVVKKNKKEDSPENIFLEASWKSSDDGERKRKKKFGFLLKSPDYFEQKPQQEEQKSFSINASRLIEAVDHVEFASGTDIKDQYLWGCQLEFQDEEIDACATNKQRICYYVESGKIKKLSENAHILCPKKIPLVAVLKNLDPSENVDISYGEKGSYLKQYNQWHYIQNVIFTHDHMPDWRLIASRIALEERSEIGVRKDFISECLKTASSASNGRYGIKIGFNSEGKRVSFSVETVALGGMVKSTYTEDESTVFITGDIDRSVVFPLENLRDFLSKVKGDVIVFRIKNEDPSKENESKESLEMFTKDPKDKIRFLSGLVRKING